MSPELVSRFHALIEEVTQELSKSGTAERPVCRADAIALLVAASEQAGAGQDADQSPLVYMLLEEQQKAAAALQGTASVPTLAFFKVC